ncbi:MAG: NAD(P)H-hydrate dehydratase [Sphingomonadaceae bacterium]
MKVVTVEQMRAIEQSSVEHGVSLDELQRNAAAAVSREVGRLVARGSRPLLFLVGPGNNGRDALIAAEMLMSAGWTVRAYLAPKVGSEDVLGRLRDGGCEVHAHGEGDDAGLLKRWVAESIAVVDGLLGIGIRGAVREPMAGIISAAGEETSRLGIPVVAVDVPSGIDADSGAVAGVALRADYTVSLGCVKTGLLKFPAAEYVGRLIPVEIGLPPASYAQIRVNLLSPDSAVGLIPRRPLNAHKGTFGRVLVVSGSRCFVGAAYLVGCAAARSGCGLVTLAVPEWQRGPLASLLPEATYLPLLDPAEEGAGEANLRAVREMLHDCSAIAVGPGLGQSPAVARLVMGLLEANRAEKAVPTVVDADGLNALAGEREWWTRVGEGHVLTPHPGEMSRLSGLPTAEINRDRWEVARGAAERWGQVVVLKGAFTVIAEPGGVGWVSPFALPALASGGTGDVLTGLIAGLIAQGTRPAEAARAAVVVHALAAERWLAENGADRMLASDLLPHLPRVIRELEPPGRA